jgi:RNA polymerase sigma-70 factor (ECF subfamily)
MESGIGTLYLQTLAAARGSSFDTTSMPAVAARDLDVLIARLHEEARREFAPVDLAIEEYARHLAVCAANAPGHPDPVPAVDSLCTLDLYLACAAALDRPVAREMFVRRFLHPLTGAIRAIHPDPAFGDEVRQALQENLLVGAAGGPRILQYGGRAPLSSWLNVAAQRAALGLLRAEDAHRRAVEKAALEPALELDPELQYLKDLYRDSFNKAVEVALTRLTERQRMILKLHTINGLTLARIGAMLGVDESTVSRWLQRAREDLRVKTNDALGAALGLNVSEVPSLARLVHSQLDVSIARILADDLPTSRVTGSR